MKFAWVRTEPQTSGFNDLRTGVVFNPDRMCRGNKAAIVADELQPVEIAVVTAAIRAFEFHSLSK